MIAILLLFACCLVGLALVPLGLPGLWLMVLGVLGYGWLTDFRTVGVAMMALVVALAVIGELLEWWLGFRVTERYGGSRRAGWGALWGGLAGAAIGIPVPVLGSVIGSFLGSFVGAAVFEYTRAAHAGTAVRAGWGAVLGRAAAAAAKIALGLAIAVVALFVALRSPASN